ncbi:MAG: hypothetical protein ACTSO7_00905 [Candidatus Heimdallarchaeota archaeon]
MRKTNKIIQKILALSILFVIGFGLAQIKDNTLVSGVFPAGDYIGEHMTWNVENITSENNQWLNWTSFSFQANWHADIGDKLNISIIGYKTISEKDYLECDFKFGNLSLETNDYDIGYNLAISCYPWNGGLIALESNWYDLVNQAPFNTTTTTIDTDTEYTIFGKIVNAVKVEHDDGFQTSVIYYEKDTGVLLYVDTKAGFFRLTLKLEDVSLGLPSKTDLSGIGFITSILVASTSLLLIKKKK